MHAMLYQVAIPFHRPFGHVVATRHAAEAIVLVVEADNLIGVGECVPRSYVTGETFDTVWEAITRLDLAAAYAASDRTDAAALASSIEQLDLPTRLTVHGVPGLAATCAVELALLDLACRRTGCELAALTHAIDLPPTLVADHPLAEVISVPLDFHSEPERIAPLAERGLGHLKVKVGVDLARDVARVRECRALLGPRLSMSIDANMAWGLDEALRAADALRPYDIAWFEEPLRPDHRSLYPALRARGGVAVMLDEAACGYAQTARAIAMEACDLINIRISKCGGFLASLRLAELAHHANIGFQHGAQVGQLGFLNAAGRHFTRSIRGAVACEGGPGLANLSDFPTRRKVELDWSVGHLVGLAGPGLGVEPDVDKLRRYAVRTAAWTNGRWTNGARSAYPSALPRTTREEAR